MEKARNEYVWFSFYFLSEGKKSYNENFRGLYTPSILKYDRLLIVLNQNVMNLIKFIEKTKILTVLN
jgi:hypothetical protein